jgi:kynurenine formamidase
MLGANKYQIENLANLDELPPTGAKVFVGVLPVRGGSQAQARVVAFLP